MLTFEGEVTASDPGRGIRTMLSQLGRRPGTPRTYGQSARLEPAPPMMPRLFVPMLLDEIEPILADTWWVLLGSDRQR
jgi:hypothetical protein